MVADYDQNFVIEKTSPQGTPEPYRLLADLPSLDDAPKPWDTRVLTRLLNSNDDRCAGVEYFLAVLLQSLTYSQEYILSSYSNSSNLFVEFQKKLKGQFEESINSFEPQIVNERNEADKTARMLKFDLNIRISEVEHKFLENLVVPGINRKMMPVLPEISSGPRHAAKCEIYPFSSFSIPEFERLLLLKHIEGFLQEKTGETWDLSSRGYSEILSKTLLKQVISKAMIHDPEVHPIYYSRNDSLILILTHIIPDKGVKNYN